MAVTSNLLSLPIRSNPHTIRYYTFAHPTLNANFNAGLSSSSCSAVGRNQPLMMAPLLHFKCFVGHIAFNADFERKLHQFRSVHRAFDPAVDDRIVCIDMPRHRG